MDIKTWFRIPLIITFSAKIRENEYILLSLIPLN
jgi:hypothetical protein